MTRDKMYHTHYCSWHSSLCEALPGIPSHSQRKLSVARGRAFAFAFVYARFKCHSLFDGVASSQSSVFISGDFTQIHSIIEISGPRNQCKSHEASAAQISGSNICAMSALISNGRSDEHHKRAGRSGRLDTFSER